MLDSKNMITIAGNLVADLEVINDKIVKGAIGVAMAGTQDNKSESGFFDFVYFLNDDSPNSKFVKNQIANGNMSKGSAIALIGRIVQERFTTKEGTKASKVKIYAEAVDYYGYSKREDKDTSADAAHVAAVPDGW